MHQTRPVTGIVGQIIKMKSQGVDQRTRIIPMARMHDHTCFLIDHKEIIIFKYNIQWDVLWSEQIFIRWMLKKHTYLIKRLDLIIGFYRNVININTTVFCSCLNFITGGVLDEIHQVFINTKWGLPLFCRKSVMLIKLIIILIVYSWVAVDHSSSIHL